MSVRDRLKRLELHRLNASKVPIVVFERDPGDPPHDHDGVCQRDGETDRQWAERFEAVTGRPVILFTREGAVEVCYYSGTHGWRTP